MRITVGAIFIGFVLMFCVSTSLAETIVVPPVEITSLVHSSYYDSFFEIQQYRDSVTFPSGPGVFSGPGFWAFVGNGDTIKVRFQTSLCEEFAVTKHPTASSTIFSLNAYWFTGVGDAYSYVSTGTVTFENLIGTAPTSTYEQFKISDNSEAIKVVADFNVIDDFSFTAMEIEFTISQPLSRQPRSHGAIDSSSSPSFGVSASGPSGLPDQTLMEIVPATSIRSDDFGYVLDCTIASNLRDISTTGTAITLADEQVSGSIGIPFDFNFYGEEVSEIYVSSNGFIYMNNDRFPGCCSGQPLSLWDVVDGIIAGFWNDLDPNAGGTVRHEVLGTTPDRELVVGFYNVPYFEGASPDPNVTFEIIIHEGSQNIELQYGDAPANTAGSVNTTTVGIEDFQHSYDFNPSLDNLQIAYGSNVAFSNAGVLITHPCPYRLAGDLNFDCVNDLLDLAIRAQTWLTDCIATPTQENGSGDIVCIPFQKDYYGLNFGLPLGIELSNEQLVSEVRVQVPERWLSTDKITLAIRIDGVNGGDREHGNQVVSLSDAEVLGTERGIAYLDFDWTTDTHTPSSPEDYTACVQILINGSPIGAEMCNWVGKF